MRSRSVFFALVAIVEASAFALAPRLAAAQQASSGGGVSGAGAAASISSAGPRPEEGMPFNGWILYPSVFFGYIFNDNVYATATNRVSASGVRVRPSLNASLDTGLHKTSIFMNADAQYYPGVGSGQLVIPGQGTQISSAPPSNVTGHAGLSHKWEPMSDLSFQFGADFTRQSGLSGANSGAAGAQQPYTPSIGVFSAAQQYSNQYSAAVSVEKKIEERWFLRGTTGIQYIAYDSRPTIGIPNTGVATTGSLNTAQNGTSYTASLRGGYWVTPQLNAYVEAGPDLRRYQNSLNDTNGYRVVGGLSSPMISLFKGEIYGGYQSQSSDHGLFGSVSSPTYGGRLSYYPTRDLTLSASVDSTLGSIASTNLGFATPLGLGGATQASAASQTQQARVEVDYDVNSYVKTYLRGGVGETRTSTPWTVSSVYSGATGVSYTFWRNTAVTFDYEFLKTNVTTDALTRLTSFYAAGYTKNLVSLGVTYRY